jgi:DNA-binding response OmpR family regulator
LPADGLKTSNPIDAFQDKKGYLMLKPLGIIIEDYKEIGKIFTIALQNNFGIEWYMDGFKALARLIQVVPAIIILDLNLPQISGKDILRSVMEQIEAVVGE